MLEAARWHHITLEMVREITLILVSSCFFKTYSAKCPQPLFNPRVEFLVTSTLEGATVTYGCPGTEFSLSICGQNGQWSPNTTLLVCPTLGTLYDLMLIKQINMSQSTSFLQLLLSLVKFPHSLLMGAC